MKVFLPILVHSITSISSTAAYAESKHVDERWVFTPRNSLQYLVLNFWPHCFAFLNTRLLSTVYTDTQLADKMQAQCNVTVRDLSPLCECLCVFCIIVYFISCFYCNLGLLLIFYVYICRILLIQLLGCHTEINACLNVFWQKSENWEFSLLSRTIIIWALKSGEFHENYEGCQPC